MARQKSRASARPRTTFNGGGRGGGIEAGEKYTWRYCAPLIELIRMMPGNGWMILMAMKGGGGGKLYCRSGEEGNKQCAR